jgi:hypothetical protein
MQAKVSIENKIDKRIELKEPIPEDILQSIEKEIDERERKKAIDALWKLCGFDDKADDYVKKIGKEHISKGLEHRKNGKKAHEIKDGNYWEYLIVYDQYEFFPKGTLGYFYDAGQLFTYFKGGSEFNRGGLYNCLEQIKKNSTEYGMQNIIKKLESEKDAESYRTQTTTEDGLKQYIIAPLYLLLRDNLRDVCDIHQTHIFNNKNLEELSKTLGDSFKYAIVLLGAFFGFQKFYDVYYDSLNLRFYKKSSKEKTPTKPTKTGNQTDSEETEKATEKPERETPTESPETSNLTGSEEMEKAAEKPEKKTSTKPTKTGNHLKQQGTIEFPP